MHSRTISAIILFFTLLLSFQPVFGATSQHLTVIDDMTNLLKQESLSINSWEMIVKEKIDPSRIDQIKKQIKEHFPQSTFDTYETDKVVKHYIEHTADTGVNERFIILEPINNKLQSEMIYLISGEKWNGHIKTIYSIKLANLENSVFSSNSQKLGCVTAVSNDMIDSVYFIKNVMRKLDVQPVKNVVNEKDFTVFSGYTSKWNTAIPVSDAVMNFQMAARKGLGGKTTITIGTPIIVTEY